MPSGALARRRTERTERAIPPIARTTAVITASHILHAATAVSSWKCLGLTSRRLPCTLRPNPTTNKPHYYVRLVLRWNGRVDANGGKGHVVTLTSSKGARLQSPDRWSNRSFLTPSLQRKCELRVFAWFFLWLFLWQAVWQAVRFFAWLFSLVFSIAGSLAGS